MSCCVPNCTSSKRTFNMTFHTFPHPIKDLIRYKKWINFVRNPKISKDPMVVYRRNRVCRLHFGAESMNGECRRLLNTAVPTIYNDHGDERRGLKRDIIDFNTSDATIIKRSRVDTGSCSFENVLPTICNNVLEIDDDYDEDFCLQEIDNSSEKDSILVEKEKIDTKINIINEDLYHSDYSDNNTGDLEDQEYEILEMIASFEKSPLTEETLNNWRSNFESDPKNQLAQNICARIDPFEVCLSRKAFEKTHHVFNYKIESEGKPVTSQKSSGRCWIFAALNVMRVPFMKKHKLEEFEFSQGYLFYWDKIERCNYFLNNIVEATQRGEDVEGRVISFLLTDPTCDGGQWDMFCNLVNKHGLMPKKCFMESFSCEASLHMNAILKSKLREYAKILHEMFLKGDEEELIKSVINHQMSEIYDIVGICLGIPPKTFTWEYYADKSKEFSQVGPITPQEFYETLVKPVFNVDDKVCIVSDPRPTSAYGKAYSIEYLGNMVGGRPVFYNNQPIELLMDLVRDSLKSGEPVWFGCEVSKRFAGKLGIEDLEIHDFKLVFNVDIQITMSKADRLRYGESAMTHAMAFTACSVDAEEKTTKFRVENSWGEDRGAKGYLIMSADWFKEFVFEIVVDKSIVPADVMKVFETEPIVLPAWDPMGTLANGNGSS